MGQASDGRHGVDGHVGHEPGTAPTRESKQRREALLRAAAEVIGERGLAETRLSDITRRAGVSPPLAVYYFETKDRLLAEALAYADLRFYDETLAELATLPTAQERLVRLIERSCPQLLVSHSYGQWALWIESWVRALRDPHVDAKRHVLDLRWRETIAQIVREGHRDLEFAPVDIDEFVLRLAAIIDGLMIQVVLDDPTLGAREMREVVVGMTARELGFQAPPFAPQAPHIDTQNVDMLGNET